MIKQKLQKAEGELIGYTISMVFLIFILLMVVGIFYIGNANTKMEQCSEEVARDIIVCTSMSDAKKLAKKEVKEKLKGVSNITNLKTKVTFSSGSGSDWVKGSFIDVTVSGNVHTLDPFTSGIRTTTTTIMIERNESSD